MNSENHQRRMISTYPFKYTYTKPEVFFKRDKVALYVHIPFCLKKCHYCSYISSVNSDEEFREQYVQALCKEIRSFAKIECYPNYSVETIYFGGGTPSMLSAKQINDILNACKETFQFLDGIEMCMEFDPSTVTEDKLQKYKEIGFNRISFGVQSFNDTVLKACNRSHSSQEAKDAINLAKKYGFSNFNIDLIYPLQYQSMENLEQTLLETINLKPAAITAHVLEVWPKTKISRLLKEQGYKFPTYEEEIKMTNKTYDILEANGFKRWSTCGYYHPERTNHYCLFMDYYWRTYSMIGFGASAKTVLGQHIYTKVSSINEYMKRINNNESALDFSVKMTKRQEMLRVIIRGLKACFIEKEHFWMRFGVSLNAIFGEEIKYLVEKGWLLDLEDKITLTRAGQVYDRDVYSIFYTEDDMRAPKEDEIMWGLSEAIEKNCEL